VAATQARDLFNEGADRARRGDWSQALTAFERSGAMRPHAVTTYNIGYCERALGRYTRARKMLGKALAENAAHGGVELPDELATAAKTYLAEVERQIARAVVSLAPEGATVLVDGRPLERAVTDGPRPVLWAGTRDLGSAEPTPASTFQLDLDPGAHTFVVAKAGYADDVATRSFEPGAESNLVIQLSARAAPSVASGPEAVEGGGPTVGSRVPAYIAWGVGAAGLVTGAIAGAIAIGENPHCSKTTGCEPVESRQLGVADTAADVSTAGFIVGGAGAVTGGILWWLSGKRSAASTVKAAKSEASLKGRVLHGVEIAPWVTPTGGGVVGTF
jgi:hypothetical protein